ncbi:MAG: restriction endonuclease subunit S [Anaerolineae bacterium]|nr:restriction endonuclease subunit S [Anaerolineae bacterium]
MRVVTTTADALHERGRRLDGSYHASDGVKAERFIRRWAGVLRAPGAAAGSVGERATGYSSRRLDRLDEVCKQGGVFIPGRFKRVYVDDPAHGERWLSPSDMLKADLSDLRLVSRKYTPSIETLRVHKGWILLSRSGTIGNMAYVREDMDGLVGSDDIIRIVPDTQRILPGYLYAYLNSSLAQSLIEQKTYGAVVPHIEAHHVMDLPIPRLDPAVEQRIHELIERAAALRVEAKQGLECAQTRFLREVLNISPGSWEWQCTNEHAYAVGIARFYNKYHRLDGFHYVGYVGEAEKALRGTELLGELIDPYQPPIFKRPYTDDTGIPFLSGMDLYNAYPKPRLYISRKMKNLDRYIVAAGTILVQNVGQRYGLFGRPTILPKHLDQCSVTQHLMRVYPKDPQDRGFVYLWLSTEFGRRLLLKQSFGTSMGVLFEDSFRNMPVPACPASLRHSFESEVQRMCEQRETANDLEDQAQAAVGEALNYAEYWGG